MNSVKEISIKNHAYNFLNNKIYIKNLDPNKIKINENSCKNIHIYHIGYLAVKSSS